MPARMEMGSLGRRDAARRAKRTPVAVTIRDVARAAQVSVATVSRALNDSQTVTDETRKHVLRIAHALDFVPHGGARSLSLRRTDTIGVLLPDLHGEYFSELIRGLDLGARSGRQHLLLSASHGEVSEAVAALRAMRSRVDGLVVMTPFADGELVAAAVKRAVPLVLLNSRDTAHCDVSFAIDNHAGAFNVAKHLIARGHRRIAFVSGPADNVEARDRLRGFKAAHREAGQAPGRILRGNFREESGFAAACQLLASELPDAIFAANDAMAIGCLHALKSEGVQVPRDIALAGFDDIPIARLLDPPLTTAGVPIAEIGRQAADCCIDLIRGKKIETGCRLSVPELVIRASSGRQSGTGAAPSAQSRRIRP
ncbi:MAG: LacI family transcriptional regulator [Alphaproteobacteria bacterium]|nr:LacI family transcriptional regulator [Alphaproteobacteria bacterium]